MTDGQSTPIDPAATRRRAEEAAARAESRLRDAIDNLAGAFVLWDADDRLVLYNDKARELYGSAPGIMVPGTPYAEVLRRAVAAGHLDAPGGDASAWINERVRRHRACSEVLTRRYPDGRWMRITEHRTREGGVVGIGVDITELKRREIELERAREQAEQANRAKSRFLAAASHDLRQPLHAMGLFLASLAGRVRGQRNRDLIGSLQDSLDTLNELFSAILDLSRLEAARLRPDIRPVSLSWLFDRMERRFTLAAEAKGLRLTVVPTRLAGESDPGMLERIVSNLIANAVQHTGQGRVLVGCRRLSGSVRIDVWDTGPGIPREELAEIFKEYHQLANPERDRRRGLGLGLAIVDRLGRLLRHRIDVRSWPGRGSRFSVTVPRADADAVGRRGEGGDGATASGPADSLPAVGVPGPAAMLAGRRVVVIDDEPGVLAAMGAVLADLGCRPLLAEGPEEAVAGLPALEGPPDLVIVDYRLRGGTTGSAAIARVRDAAGREAPGIIVTGESDPARLAEARASGFELLHKPVRAANLAAVMRFVLAGGRRRP